MDAGSLAAAGSDGLSLSHVLAGAAAVAAALSGLALLPRCRHWPALNRRVAIVAMLTPVIGVIVLLAPFLVVAGCTIFVSALVALGWLTVWSGWYRLIGSAGLTIVGAGLLRVLVQVTFGSEGLSFLSGCSVLGLNPAAAGAAVGVAILAATFFTSRAGQPVLVFAGTTLALASLAALAGDHWSEVKACFAGGSLLGLRALEALAVIFALHLPWRRRAARRVTLVRTRPYRRPIT